MTIMVINRDPSNTANVTFNLNGFNPSLLRRLHAEFHRFQRDFSFNFHGLDRDPEFCAI